MRASVLGALIGALTGFATVLLLNVLVISNPLVRAVLFPGNLCIRYATNKGMGDFGLMIFDSLAYFSNLLLYAAVGFALGRLLESKRTAPATEESSR